LSATSLKAEFHLCQEIKNKIDKEAGKYPVRQAAVKSALRYCQEKHGWISEAVVRAIADYLNLRAIEVYEVATFYDMFYTQPTGRHCLRVCTNVSCMLRGAEDIVNHIRSTLNVECGGTSSDGRITLFESECLGACGGAPMMICGDQYVENITADKVDALLAELE
tara:strand:- start:3495 stop:3989 length:495 start_codon:yes stop_codon:yes gene_type:complete